MKTLLAKQESSCNTSHRHMFHPAQHGSWKRGVPPFFQTGLIRHQDTRTEPFIQRQENTEPQVEEKDPIVEGLKTTGEQLLKYPKFKAWYEPKLDLLKQRLWEQQPSETKAVMVTYGGINLALAGLIFALNPEVRELLSDVNIGKPLGWIPYSPLEGFKYKLPEAGKSAYGFSADFTLSPYLELLRKHHPQIPLTGATFGLETNYTQEQGISVTGGKFGLEFLGGGLKAEGKTFSELSPYPMMALGAGPFDSPSMLMQSVPGLPPLQTPGFQMTVSADLYKLFPGLTNLF